MKYTVLIPLFALALAWPGAQPAPAADLPGPQTRPLSSPIAPAPRPTAKSWSDMTVVDLLTGARRTLDVTRLGGDAVRVRAPDGCVWTQSADWFAPSDSWQDCGPTADWHTASATVSGGDTLWPLTQGARGKYRRKAVSFTGDTSTRTTRCKVVDAVEVLRPKLKPTPAYVVECSDKRRRSLTWYAPDQGPIAYVEEHRSRGVEEAWTRVR